MDIHIAVPSNIARAMMLLTVIQFKFRLQMSNVGVDYSLGRRRKLYVFKRVNIWLLSFFVRQILFQWAFGTLLDLAKDALL